MDVMLENYGRLLSIGCDMSKADVILRLKRGEDPWASFAEENWRSREILMKFKEHHDKYPRSFVYVNYKELAKQKSSTYPVHPKDRPPECDTCGDMLESVSELINSNLSPARKRQNEYNEYLKPCPNSM